MSVNFNSNSPIAREQIAKSLQLVQRESLAAVLELIELCNHPGYQFVPFNNSKQILLKYHLIDESGCVDDKVKQVVLKLPQKNMKT